MNSAGQCCAQLDAGGLDTLIETSMVRMGKKNVLMMGVMMPEQKPGSGTYNECNAKESIPWWADMWNVYGTFGNLGIECIWNV